MATAELRRIQSSDGYDLEGVPGTTKVLRGNKYKRGWVAVGHHDGTDDRMMAYPTGGFNSAVTLANGGPLAVAGADANGGFRVIAKQPNVKFQVANGAAPLVTVTESTIYKIVLLTAPVASATAAECVQYVTANAEANKLIDLTYTGTGAGLIAVAAATLAPWVRVLGLFAGEYDASDTTGSDVAVDQYDYAAQIMIGSLGLVNDTTTPAIAGQDAWISDNVTATGNWAPLLLPVLCEKVRGELAYCRLPRRAN